MNFNSLTDFGAVEITNAVKDAKTPTVFSSSIIIEN
jgi:hypothetical protein